MRTLLLLASLPALILLSACGAGETAATATLQAEQAKQLQQQTEQLKQQIEQLNEQSEKRLEQAY
nr:hypothetical protein [uncultured Pseudomonas sp.]